jgi:hypothetical protein
MVSLASHDQAGEGTFPGQSGADQGVYLAFLPAFMIRQKTTVERGKPFISGVLFDSSLTLVRVL